MSISVFLTTCNVLFNMEEEEVHVGSLDVGVGHAEKKSESEIAVARVLLQVFIMILSMIIDDG